MRKSLKTLGVVSALVAGIAAAPALYGHESQSSQGSMMGRSGTMQGGPGSMMGGGNMMGMMNMMGQMSTMMENCNKMMQGMTEKHDHAREAPPQQE